MKQKTSNIIKKTYKLSQLANQTKSTSTTNPTLDMKTIVKNTLQVYSSGIENATANSTKFIFFSFSSIIPDWATVVSVKLKFKQLNNSTEGLVLRQSNDRYFIMQGYDVNMDYSIEGGSVYRYVDISRIVSTDIKETKYFAIETTSNNNEIKLYTDYATSENEPELIYEYLPNSDFYRHQQYLSGEVGKGAYVVNIRNGRLDYGQSLLETSGTRSPLNISLHYNIDKKTSSNVSGNIVTGMPYGWKLNYQQYVYKSGNNYIYIDGEYKKHTFKLADNLTSGTIYYEIHGNRLILNEITENNDSYFEITNGRNDTLRFNSSGYLIKISSKYSNSYESAVTITYTNNLITKITDGVGREATISYNYVSGTTNIASVVITKPDSNTTTITCFTESVKKNILQSISETNGSQSAFDYYEKQLKPTLKHYTLKSVYSNEKKVILQYNNSNQINEITETTLKNNITTGINNYYQINRYPNETQVVHIPHKTNISTNNNIRTYIYRYNDIGECYTTYELAEGVPCNVKAIFEDDYQSYQYNDYYRHSYYRNDPQTTVSGGQYALESFDLPEEIYAEHKEYYLLLTGIVSQNGSMNYNTTKAATVKIYQNYDENPVIIATVNFEPSLTGILQLHVVKANVVYLEHPSSKITIRYEVEGNGLEVNYNSVEFCEIAENAVLSAVNFNNQSEFLTSVNNINFYNANDIEYRYTSNDTEIVVPVATTFTTEDYANNLENYYLAYKDTTNIDNHHHLWYNNGKNMYANVKGVAIKYKLEQFTPYLWIPLGQIKCGKIIGKGTIKNVNYVDYNYNTTERKIIEYKTYEKFSESNQEKVSIINDYYLVTKEILNNSYTTEYNYDGYGNVIKETQDNINEDMNILYPNVNKKTDYAYQASNLLGSVSNRMGEMLCKTEFEYNSLGNLTVINSPKNDDFVINEYDLDNETLKIVKCIFNQEGTPLNNQNTITRDSNNKITSLSHNNFQYSFTYDEYNELASIARNNQTIVSFNYQYLHDRTIQTIIYGNNQQLRYTYNKYGKLTIIEKSDSLSNPNFIVLRKYFYSENTIENNDPFSPLLRVTPSSPLLKELEDNCSIEYTYNCFGNLTEKSENKDERFRMYRIYDCIENNDQMYLVYKRKDVCLTVDPKENPIRTENLKQAVTRSTRRKQIMKETVYPNGKKYINCIYGERLNRLPVICDDYQIPQNNKTIDYAYEYHQTYKADTHMSTRSSSDFIDQQIFECKEDNKLIISKIMAFNNDVNGNITEVNAPVYDANGNLNNTIINHNKYYYDEGNRLIRENNYDLNRTYTFSYDVGGNITYKKEYAYTNGETLGVLLNTNTYTYHSVNKDQLISLNTKNCSYDIYGNPTTYMNDTLTWSRGTMLATYTTALNPKTITYTYDGEGSRTSKSWGVGLGRVSYEFHIEDDQLKEEERKGHNLNIKIEYIHGVNRLMGFKYNNTDYYYRRDIFGNVIEIYDKLTMVARYIYDAWGNHEVINYNGSNIGSINPIRYRGYYYDIETGLYYCNSRYYDPAWGRFISPDSIDYLDPESINGLNLYSYCNNNPVMYYDPSGHMPKWLAWTLSGLAVVGGVVLCATGVGGILGGILIGAGAGSIINGYVSEASGGDFTAGYIGGAISGALCGVGAGLGGMAFAAASEAVNLSCIGYLSLGVATSFAGGFAGNLAGTIYTSWHNSGFKNVDVNWRDTLVTSTIMGSLNIFAGMGSAMSSITGFMGRVATNTNSQFALRFLAGFIAGGTEAAYDLVSYIISKLLSAF